MKEQPWYLENWIDVTPFFRY